MTAVAFVYVMRGRPLRWLDGLHDDVPAAVLSETGGSGDDIRLELRDGKSCEVQVKRGLTTGKGLWKSLLAMGRAITSGAIDFGVLAVSPTSSQTIREELATTVIRLGEGRLDSLPSIGTLFVEKLQAEGLDPKAVCHALRIVTVSAMKIDDAAIGTAHAELGHVCRSDIQIRAAWNVLYRDAVELIEHKGRRDFSSLVQLLRSNAIAISIDGSSPAPLLNRLSDWTLRTNETFAIFGVTKPLRLSKAWIPLQAIVRESDEQPADLRAALAAYQSWQDREYSRDATTVDPETLGRFIKLVVLVAGPGMGKTTLLRRIAHRYAADGIPVLRVRLSAVAARMRTGKTFEEAVFALGLDGSGITAEDAISADLRNWLLLCDGLDETGASQSIIAAAAESFAEGHPDCRVIVTTRPVGYHASNLRTWRHYDIVPLDRSSAADYLTKLLREIGDNDSDPERDWQSIAKEELWDAEIKKVVSRSPLLLALGASVIARGGSLSGSRSRLYERLFALVDDAPNNRIPEPPAEPAILRRVLDVLAWEIVANPIVSIDTVLTECARVLIEEAGLKRLAAHGAAQTYLRYWEDVGLIERVGQGDAETLIFIHKTFGEFAAGRRLATMDPAERTTAFTAIGTDDAWDEALNFAALLGIADDVCSHILVGADIDSESIDKIARSLEVCGEADPAPSDAIRERVIDLAYRAIRSPRRQWAVEIGLATIPVARRYPDEIAPRCSPLLGDPQSWTRLAAWAALAASGPPHLDLDRLQSAIVTEAASAEESTWSSHGGGLVLGSGTVREIAQVFVLEGGRQLLDHRPSQATDDAVVAAFRLKDLGNLGFLRRASRLLEAHGKSYNLWPDTERGSLHSLLNPSAQYLEARRKAYAALFDAIDDSGETLPPPPKGSKLLILSAFMQSSGYSEMSSSDVWAWTHPFDPLPVRETARVAIVASGLDAEQLKQEVRTARALLVQKDVLLSVFEFTSEVDAGLTEWEAARGADPDIRVLEIALYHRSHWVIRLAAISLDAIADGSVKTGIVKRGIEKGQGDTLWAIAAIARQLCDGQLIDAIYERLSRDATHGCEHLIAVLPDLAAPFDLHLLQALEIGLLYSALETAMQAAEVALHYAKVGQVEHLAVLERAAEYWKIHEKPYPTKGGVIPSSPREKIAEASAAITPPDYGRLKAYAADSRSDVRELGIKMLIARLSEQAELAEEFLDDVGNNTVASNMLDKALTAGVTWHNSALARVEELFLSAQVALRFAAMALLGEDYLSPDCIRVHATLLTKDDDRQIRERAFRILDGMPKVSS